MNIEIECPTCGTLCVEKPDETYEPVTVPQLVGDDIGLLRGVRDQLSLDGHGQLADRMTALLCSMEADA